MSRGLGDVYKRQEVRTEALQQNMVFLASRNYIGLDHTKKH